VGRGSGLVSAIGDTELRVGRVNVMGR
jgi:hypothetical protein